MCVSGPTQFKLVLFKDQLYFKIYIYIYTLISLHQVLETKILEGLNSESTFKFLLVEKPWVEKRTCHVATAADKSLQLCPTLKPYGP